MHGKISKAMADAVAAYTGPVTRCRPGRARGQRIKAKNDAVQWLVEHRDNPTIADPKARRRRLRKHYAQQQRVTQRNGPILERIGKQERRAAFNQAVMHRLNEQQRSPHHAVQAHRAADGALEDTGATTGDLRRAVPKLDV